MEIKELRVGNLVADGSKITEVTTGMLSNWDVINKDFGGYQPIELNEEWLLRFGFNPDHNDYFFECEKHGIELEASWSQKNITTGETFGWCLSDYQHIKHVHQLQNLYFALTNEELKLKEL